MQLTENQKGIARFILENAKGNVKQEEVEAIYHLISDDFCNEHGISVKREAGSSYKKVKVSKRPGISAMLDDFEDIVKAEGIDVTI